MHENLSTVCKSIDDLVEAVESGYDGEDAMVNLWGWNCPPLNKNDLADLARNLSNNIKYYNIEELDDEISQKLETIPIKIRLFEANTLPYLFNGNAAGATSVYLSLITWIESVITPLFKWQNLKDNKLIPSQLYNRLRAIQAEINSITPDKETLINQIHLIQDATATATSLPTDLENLTDARNKVNALSTSAAELYGKIDTIHTAAEQKYRSITSRKTEADGLVEKCEEAYRITTTKGLAASFDQRAKRLSNTMWVWVLGLMLALIAGSYIGASRFEALANSLQDQTPQWGVIWMDFGLSVIGLAAPIWFAWLATKQISQRFRLAEDYAFKASVAKAYEGYRKEAVRIDEAFEARLFSSALSRLEEAPLRLVDNDHHNSPWQELLSSTAFQQALETVPDLKDKFVSIVKDGVNNLTNRGRINKKEPVEKQD